VDLAPLTDPTLVAQVIARALNVVEQPGAALMDTLLDSLCERQTLLVLDNCEHLLAACAQLDEAGRVDGGIAIVLRPSSFVESETELMFSK